MKKAFLRMSKDRFLISAMCACILMVSAAGVISVYNKNNRSGDDDLISQNQTETETETGTKTTKAAGTKTSEEETGRQLVVKLETAESSETTQDETQPEQQAAAQPQTEPQTESQTEPQTEPQTVADNQPQTQETDTLPVSADETYAAAVLNFNEQSVLGWPVRGEIIREFSMDTTVWFSTLKQYQTSSAIQIQSEEGTLVFCPCDAVVDAVGSTDELGQFVLLDLGNGYKLKLAQLTGICVNPQDALTKGQAIANVAAPSYYYALDGANVYMQLTKDGVPIDPLPMME